MVIRRARKSLWTVRRSITLDKFYLVEEEELVDLIATYYEIMMLQRDGIDNWSWHRESHRDILKERSPEATEGDLEDLEDMDFYDWVRADLENYVLAKESWNSYKFFL